MDYSISNCENDKEEWKEIFNDILLEQGLQTLCSFLNSYGGKIIYGVDNNGEPKKLKGDIDDMQQQIFNKTKAHLKPNASSFFRVTIHEDKLYIFAKADTSQIYQYKNVIYKRTGSSTHALTFDEAKNLEEQRKNHTTEIAPQIYTRNTQGEFLKCNKCEYSEISGMSVVMSIGSPPKQKLCPKCGDILTSNL